MKADETLLKISTDISGIAEKVDNMDRKLFGNGQPGLVQEFDRVKNNQDHCIQEKKNRKIDIKWILILLIVIVQTIFMYIK